MDKYFNFIEENLPTFEKDEEGNLIMFTAVTQRLYGGSIKELLDKGIEISKDSGGKSPMYYLFCKLNENLK